MKKAVSRRFPAREEIVDYLRALVSERGLRPHLRFGSGVVSARFDDWLAQAVAAEPGARDAALADWSQAPMARQSHPREEHLLPLMVVAGAAGPDRGKHVLRDEVMGAVVSAFRFD